MREKIEDLEARNNDVVDGVLAVFTILVLGALMLAMCGGLLGLGWLLGGG